MCEFAAFIPKRLILSFLAFVGFSNLYLIRFNFSVINVSMVARHTYTEEYLCKNASSNCTNDKTFMNNSLTNEETAVLSNSSIVYDEKNTLYWDEKTRATVLSAFFYGYCLTQIIGGRLAELFGTKLIFGTSVAGPAILSLLLPVVSRASPWGTFTVRFIQGCLQGMSWPSMHALLGQWFPISERARFMGTVFFASTLSMVYVMPLSGYLCEKFSWEMAFYISGVIPIIWSIFWFTMVYDKPGDHPSISDAEKFFIEEAVHESGTSKHRMKSVPWETISKSLPFIALVVCDVGHSYSMVIFTAQMANYLSSVYDFSLSKTGFLAGLPFLCRYIGSVMFSTIADFLIKKKYLSVINTRRIFSAIALFLPSLMIVLIVTTTKDDSFAFIVYVCVYMFFNGGVAAAHMVNNLDIAPNYAGTLFGISNTCSTFASAISIWVSGQILTDAVTWEEWRIVFSTLIPALVVCEIFYLIFLSGSPQEWNFYHIANQEDGNDELPQNFGANQEDRNDEIQQN